MIKNSKYKILILCLIVGVLLTACSNKKEDNDTGDNVITGTVTDNKQTDNDTQTEDSEGSEQQSELKPEEIAFMVGDRPVSYTEVILYMQADIEKTEALYGKDIWNLKLDDTGATVGEAYKDEILKQISYVKIVCSQAENLNISLSEDELLDVTLYTEDFMAELTDEQISKYGITNELVYGIYCDNMLANKVYEVLTLNIDTAVTEEEVRNMVLQYINISKFYRDANGKQLEYDADELETIKAQAQEFLDNLKETGVTSLTELEQDKYQITEITAGKDGIVEELSPELGGLAFGLREGEFSDIYETDYGFYILFCAKESDEEATERATIAILEERQRVLFEDLYNVWEANTRIKVNWDVWDTLDWY